jgi:hypothetical protein
MLLKLLRPSRRRVVSACAGLGGSDYVSDIPGHGGCAARARRVWWRAGLQGAVMGGGGCYWFTPTGGRQTAATF